MFNIFIFRKISNKRFTKSHRENNFDIIILDGEGFQKTNGTMVPPHSLPILGLLLSANRE
jgi:hypothetical protein